MDLLLIAIVIGALIGCGAELWDELAHKIARTRRRS